MGKDIKYPTEFHITKCQKNVKGREGFFYKIGKPYYFAYPCDRDPSQYYPLVEGDLPNGAFSSYELCKSWAEKAGFIHNKAMDRLK